MSRYNFNTIEKKWQEKWNKNSEFKSILDKKKKNFIVQKCFLIHQEEFIWAM